MIYNGVVGGDYALQVTDLGKANPELLVDGHEDLPEFGTRAYAEKYAHLFADTLKAYAADATYEDDEHTPGFEPLAAALRPRIHGESTAFITDQQAEDILKNAPREPPYSGAGKDILNYLFKIYRGFYPNITFYLDDANEQPNAYSLREFGSAFVVVNGGLIRTDAIQYEALAFVIAHQIGVLQGGDPKDPEGYTCRGQADYTPFLAVFPYVWFGVYSHPMVHPVLRLPRSGAPRRHPRRHLQRHLHRLPRPEHGRILQRPASARMRRRPAHRHPCGHGRDGGGGWADGDGDLQRKGRRRHRRTAGQL
jgi:hypothetical protein